MRMDSEGDVGTTGGVMDLGMPQETYNTADKVDPSERSDIEMRGVAGGSSLI